MQNNHPFSTNKFQHQFNPSNRKSSATQILTNNMTPLKIYNSMITKFNYEHNTKYRRDYNEALGDTSTPSHVTEQSYMNANDGITFFEIEILNSSYFISF